MSVFNSRSLSFRLIFPELVGRCSLIMAIGLGAALGCADVASSQPIEENPAVRIPDRPPRPRTLPSEIQPRDQNIVQIHGRWVEDTSLCRSDELKPQFLTDTLLRWQGQTCSVRDIRKTGKNGQLAAMCVSEDGRSEREFLLRREGPDRMRIQAKGSSQTQELWRCPS